MNGIKEIDAISLQKMMDEGEDLQLIDVRSQSEFLQGIIEGGEFMPLHTLPMKLNDLSNKKTIVFYCRSGARSAQACMFVSQNSSIEALNLRGGIISWYQSGLEIIRPDVMREQG